MAAREGGSLSPERDAPKNRASDSEGRLRRNAEGARYRPRELRSRRYAGCVSPLQSWNEPPPPNEPRENAALARRAICTLKRLGSNAPQDKGAVREVCADKWRNAKSTNDGMDRLQSAE